MNDSPVLFRKLACSDKFRNAVQSPWNHQPIATDKRIDALLARLAEAEDAAEIDPVRHPGRLTAPQAD